MPSITQKVVQQKIETSGEITINLVLTIKLDGNNLSVDAQSMEEPKKATKLKTISIDDDDMFIPDIQTGGIIDFGNKAKD